MSRTASMRWRRSTTTGINCWRRENVSNCRVSFSPRLAAARIASIACTSFGSLSRRCRSLRIAGDDHQQIVEVVGDAAGELAERLHLLRLGELLAGLLERDLRLVLRCDVAGDLGKADQFAGIVANGIDHHAGKEAAAVLAYPPALRLELASRPPPLRAPRSPARRRVRSSGGVELAEMPADDLVRAVALESAPRRHSSYGRGRRRRACRSRSRARP